MGPEALGGTDALLAAGAGGADATRSEFGLEDTFRKLHPEPGRYSWWDYRMLGFQKNRGLRLDHIYVTAPLAGANCRAAGIDREARKGTQPSDHAPGLGRFRRPGEPEAPTIGSSESIAGAPTYVSGLTSKGAAPWLSRVLLAVAAALVASGLRPRSHPDRARARLGHRPREHRRHLRDRRDQATTGGSG